MAYKLIYNPLIDYIRSHVRLCAAVLYSKASSLCLLLTVGWYSVACMQAESIRGVARNFKRGFSMIE